MLAALRAGLLAVPLLLAAISTTFAADKAFQRDDLADAAIKLQAQIKTDAGTVTKPVAALRRDVDAALGRGDYSTGLQLLGQMIAAAPNDSAPWLRLARTIMNSTGNDDRERAALLERASTAATSRTCVRRAANRKPRA